MASATKKRVSYFYHRTSVLLSSSSPAPRLGRGGARLLHRRRSTWSFGARGHGRALIRDEPKGEVLAPTRFRY